jgi:hypothetical protein
LRKEDILKLTVSLQENHMSSRLKVVNLIMTWLRSTQKSSTISSSIKIWKSTQSIWEATSKVRWLKDQLSELLCLSERPLSRELGRISVKSTLKIFRMLSMPRPLTKS